MPIKTTVLPYPLMAPQGRYWLLTIPHASFTPYLPPSVEYIAGQLECGASGFIHWQIIAYFKNRVRLGKLREIFGPVHCEVARSEAVEAYVWKEDTAITDTRFELGRKSGGSKHTDWDVIWEDAKAGRLDNIPASIRISSYSSLKRIEKDYLVPVGIERTCKVYWGPTGVGKSRRAWDEATMEAYPKDPRTKFWDGYNKHENVVIDEFRGGNTLYIIYVY